MSLSRIGIKNYREHREHREQRQNSFIYIENCVLYAVPTVFDMGNKNQKNIKNISKTFQKPIDILIFMCYNIRAVRGTPLIEGQDGKRKG